MSEGEFQKVTQSSERMYGPKGIIFCGFSAMEHEPLVNALSQIGFGDRPLIFATHADIEKNITDVLASADRSGMGESAEMPRAIIMSGSTQKEVHTLMTAFKEAGLPPALGHNDPNIGGLATGGSAERTGKRGRRFPEKGRQ